MREIEIKIDKICKEFLTSKLRVPWYVISAEDSLMNEYEFLEPFVDEDWNALKALREKYGAPEFVHHLEEVYDPEIIHDLTQGMEIVSIDLDKPCYKYQFGLHELIAPGQVSERVVEIVLLDDSYVELLKALIADAHMNMNSLRYANRALYNILLREIESSKVSDYSFSCMYPYLVTFNEAKADVEQIIKQHPDIAPDPADTFEYPFIF